MKKILIFLSIVTLLAVVPAAQATYIPATITLNGTNDINYTVGDPVEDVEIQLDFFLSGDNKTLTVDIYNKSNTNYAPSLTGVGFVLDPNSAISSWSLSADTSTGLTEVITDYWVLDTPGDEGNSFAFDYYSNTAPGGDPKDYSLYNPDLLLNPSPPGAILLPGGDSINYFTKATLTVVFDDAISEITEAGARLLNVGVGGEGSLKLVGIPDPYTPNLPIVPEPGTMILFGFGMIGLSGIARRKIKQ